MRSEWRKVRLEDITSKIGDGLHGTPKYDDNGEYYFINGNNIGDGKITINENTKRVNYQEYLKHKKELTDRTILVSINGTLGSVGLYNNENVCLGKSACYLNTLEEVEKEFVKYILTSNYFQDYIQVYATGTTIKNMGLKAMRDFKFKLPPLSTQKKIAHILSTLDDKIELNRKMNQTLEEMARAIFKSWFVDFDPVHAKAGCSSDEELEAAANELGISREVLDLFPSEFEESELGMIPAGWTSSNLSYVFTERKEKARDRVDLSVMSVIQTGKLVNPEDVFTKQVHSADISNYKVVYPLDLGYNPSRINIGSAGFNKSESFGAMSPVYTVMKFKDIKFHPLMELFMKQSSTKKWINTLASGSVRQSLSQKDFLSIPVIIPSDAILNQFNSIYTAFHESISAKELEISTLQQTRDTFLPKLLSGELDVSEVQL